MIFPYLYADMSLKRLVILSILSVSALAAHAKATNDTIPASDTIWFDDGALYIGQITDSLFNGYGKMVYADSTVYQGEWKDGLWEGQGEITYPDGDSYHGEFSQHDFNGYGTYIYSDGTKYEGYWENGMFNGAGTMIYANGNIYSGEWMNDMKDGIGVFYDANTDVLLQGYFRNDVFIGSDLNKSNSFSGTGNSYNAFDDSEWDPYPSRTKRPDSCWHYKGDAFICVAYGTRQMLSFHVDGSFSKRFFAGASIGIKTVNQEIGEVSVTYNEDTGEKTTLIGWDWYKDEIMTEHTYTVFRLSAEGGVSWGWFSLGTSIGVGLQNTVRNCRSLEHNNSYYEPGTLYYREKITGAKFAYDIFTDFIISRSIPYIHSCSMRTGYNNIDGFYVGAGITF